MIDGSRQSGDTAITAGLDGSSPRTLRSTASNTLGPSQRARGSREKGKRKRSSTAILMARRRLSLSLVHTPTLFPLVTTYRATYSISLSLSLSLYFPFFFLDRGFVTRRLRLSGHRDEALRLRFQTLPPLFFLRICGLEEG